MAEKIEEQCSSVGQQNDDLFTRCRLPPNSRALCVAFAEQLFPAETISQNSCQGYCSLTLCVGSNLILQCRPPVYQLDMEMLSSAKSVYGKLAPATTFLRNVPPIDLLVYLMDRISGIPLKEYRLANQCNTEWLENLCKEFARFLAKGWRQPLPSPIGQGLVGSSLEARLEAMSTGLPLRFQPFCRNVLRHLNSIKALPWVLTHGDILDTNIMVDPATGSLHGLVDWAEAEYLPFGVATVGLEEILGQMTPDGFIYAADAERLRQTFHQELRTEIPDLCQPELQSTVSLARDLGVLIWHGIAFDDGSLDRVVQEGRDDSEIAKLDAFLGLKDSQAFKPRPRI
ncbi:hypothetical protein V8E54_005143 [Elaphomyces granulatus]|jgi:hypothetical protein